MRLRFFGDSWFWCWFNPGQLKSNMLTKDSPKNLPVIEWYLKGLGVDCITHNHPGYSFKDTIKTILSSTPEDIKYNIVFVSFPCRNADIFNLDVTNYSNFLERHDKIIVDGLIQMQEYATEHDQYFLLIGGHTTLHKELFESVPNLDRLYLVSQCIMSDLMGVNPPFGIFKLADFTRYITGKFDRDLVNDVYTQLESLDKHPDKQVLWWPDNSRHLNPSAILLLTDKIFCKIEEIEKEL